MLLGFGASSIALGWEEPAGALALGAQLLLLGGAGIALFPGGRRVPGASLALFFVTVQAAYTVALALAVLGHRAPAWRPDRTAEVNRAGCEVS